MAQFLINICRVDHDTVDADGQNLEDIIWSVFDAL